MHLGARVGTRAAAPLLQRHAEQRNRNLLAGREQHVEFPWRWLLGDLTRQLDQAVCLPAHSGNHDHHVITPVAPANHLVGHIADALRTADRSTTVFLNNQCHDRLVPALPAAVHRRV